MNRYGKLAGILIAVSAIGAAAEAAEVSMVGTTNLLGLGDTYVVGENHLYFVGKFVGHYVDDNASGPFHLATVTCPGWNEPGIIAGGYCIIRDLAGDEAYLSFQCVDQPGPPAGAILSGNCTGSFLGGTGTFAGATGNGGFYVVLINVNPDGSAPIYADWNFTVSLPD
ncbi:MAG: hypothetical protein KIS96_11120 [Bauldia sp.]|nr:hypothetical protein [Bauldia sp.]